MKLSASRRGATFGSTLIVVVPIVAPHIVDFIVNHCIREKFGSKLAL
uniref:Uncharacterized protein n=1 Tax=Vitis vinifera TaxID=29760 RepID=F6HAN3_VITVI